MEFFNRFKIPTILGLSIILLGLISGLYLVLKEQVFYSQAAPDVTAQNITVSNITEDSAVISWQTNGKVSAYVSFGQNSSGEQTIFDDRDAGDTKQRLTHYVTLKDLLPQTRYQFKIVANKVFSEIKSFETAKPLTAKADFSPVIGSALDGDTPLNDGIVYLTINGAITQSSLLKTGGNFLIPLVEIRKTDLSDLFTLTENTPAKAVISNGLQTAVINFDLQQSSLPLPSIKLGQQLNLAAEKSPEPTINSKDIDKYDLNSDEKINSADYAGVSACFGKKSTVLLSEKTSCAKADINQDGKINQQDLDLMIEKLKDLVSQ